MGPSTNRQIQKGRRQTGTPYELLELREFERGTDEASAVKAVLGDPVKNLSEHDLSSLPLVIVGYDQPKLLHILDEQRSNPEVALRPVAVVGLDEQYLDPEIDQLADIVLPPRPGKNELTDCSSLLALLANQVQKLPPPVNDRPLTLLQYMHTREGVIDPVIDPYSYIAYRYPLAEHVLGTDQYQARDVMEDMARHNLLDARHVDRLFLCPECSSYKVPVKEICAECNSTHLSTQNSIHHFRCGYVAPESEFCKDDTSTLSCPKCRDPLRHIGVEYNRPGRFVICHDCGFWSSEPAIRAWCAECNRYHSPDQLVAARIARFLLNHNGTQVARNGSWNPASDSTPRRSRKLAQERPRSQALGNELSNIVGQLAHEQSGEVTAYRATILSSQRGANAEDAEQTLANTLVAVRELIGPRDVILPMNGNEFLLLMPVSEDRQTPKPEDIERHVQDKAAVKIHIGHVSGKHRSAALSGL